MADRPEQMRNLALVGHSGSGKTTLVEALLARTGEIPRAGSVAQGTTVSDHDPVEVAQQRSVALSVCRLTSDGVTVNLLDTPGYPDFTGELRAGLRAADGVLFVIAAGDDIDPITASLWEECAALSIPARGGDHQPGHPDRVVRGHRDRMSDGVRWRGRPRCPAALRGRRRHSTDLTDRPADR